MMQPDEMLVDAASVACDGGGVLGHPRVWLAIPASGRIECPYCGRAFIHRQGAGARSAAEGPLGVPTGPAAAEPRR